MKLVCTEELTAHSTLGGTSVLPALTDDEYAGLKKSIQESGIMQPIVITRPRRHRPLRANPRRSLSPTERSD